MSTAPTGGSDGWWGAAGHGSIASSKRWSRACQTACASFLNPSGPRRSFHPDAEPVFFSPRIRPEFRVVANLSEPISYGLQLKGVENTWTSERASQSCASRLEKRRQQRKSVRSSSVPSHGRLSMTRASRRTTALRPWHVDIGAVPISAALYGFRINRLH